jgi:hypothetical protein
MLRVPKIALPFIHLLRLLFFLFDRSEAFRFLISPAAGIAGRIRGLATDEKCGASHQANELKVLHMFGHVINRFKV